MSKIAESPKRIAILGATGSIGQQALQVIAAHPARFQVTLLSAASNYQGLYEAALRFEPKALMMEEPEARKQLEQRLKSTDIRVHPTDSFAELLKEVPVDLVLVAVVGFAGLAPTLAAISAGKTIALANKETLVAGGHLVMQALKDHDVALYPVDSEHSAIFQCLMGEAPEAVDKLILTASGGPFWSKSHEEMKTVTLQMALKHPNWVMGKKVSIDSATMMNKGLEVIEARWLFSLTAEHIEVLVHRQSLVHSLVQFVDGSQKAQLGPTDMRIPIQFAMSYPERLPLDVKPVQLGSVGTLLFENPDHERFPALGLCYAALRSAGNMPCALNAANECAVAAFLAQQISFVQIARVVAECLEKIGYLGNPSYLELASTDAHARRIAEGIIAVWKD